MRLRIGDIMWAHACGLMAQAEAARLRFLLPAPSRGSGPAWEAPADVYESHEELVCVVALPGVAPADVEVVVADGGVVVAGVRRLPLPEDCLLLRLEIPHGRFERRVPLPEGSYELLKHELVDGCLRLSFRKLG